MEIGPAAKEQHEPPHQKSVPGLLKASESKRSFFGLRKSSVGKVPAMPVRGAAFDPTGDT